MSTELSAWLVVTLAGSLCGVIAGLQPQVTAGTVLAISTVIAIAALVVTRILPRHPDPC